MKHLWFVGLLFVVGFCCGQVIKVGLIKDSIGPFPSFDTKIVNGIQLWKNYMKDYLEIGNISYSIEFVFVDPSLGVSNNNKRKHEVFDNK